MDSREHTTQSFRVSELVGRAWLPGQGFDTAEAACAWADQQPGVYKVERFQDGLWTIALDVGPEPAPDASRLEVFSILGGFRSMLRSRALTDEESELLATLLEILEDYVRVSHANTGQGVSFSGVYAALGEHRRGCRDGLDSDARERVAQVLDLLEEYLEMSWPVDQEPKA